jgi:hypothetical protein
MTKYLVVLSMLVLSGCATVTPVKQKWPDVPQEISEACPQLQKLPDNTEKLTDVVSTVSTNYGTYYECQAKLEAWIEWYKTQKSIYEEVK